MKVSLKWLKRYVDLDGISPDEIAEALTMLGLEVENVETIGLKPLANVVVGEILSRDPHPNSDHLGVCKVAVGIDGEPLQIVCGASNYKVGDRVPVALEGAELPTDNPEKPFKISKSKLRGVESCGMMCSARELGLGTDHSGLLILESRPQIGVSINEVFKDSEDTVFEIELTANRGDCLSHIGVARELAARFERPFKKPELKSSPSYSDKPASLLKEGVLLETENCPLYTATCIRGVKIAPSPEWMKRDLEAVGLRSINNVVDATNYVLMEYGQPLHAFDASDIRGGKIVVRNAQDGERITTLDGTDHILSSDNTVICDAEGPLALAGIMGGLNSEVKDSTTDLVIESAYFKPGNIRSTSRKLGISSDSSYRYARDVDPKGVFEAARRVSDLILETAGGRIEGDTILSGKLPRNDRNIKISKEYVVGQIGFEVSASDISNSFKRLGFGVEETGESEWNVTVPSFRSDVDRPIDLVEEFIRIYGSDKIPETPLVINASMRDDDPVFKYERAVCDLLASKGLNECQNYTLRESAKISKIRKNTEFLKLDNPLTSDQDCLRASLLDGLLDSALRNESNGNSPYGLFESGKIFRADNDGLIFELESTAFVLPIHPSYRAWRKRGDPDSFTAKSISCDILSVLGIDASRLNFEKVSGEDFWESGFVGGCGIVGREGFEVRFGAVSISHLRELGFSAPVFAGEIVFKPEVAARKRGSEKFKSFGSFPASERDIALVVEKSLPASEAEKEILKAAKKSVKGFSLESVSLFDVYEGKGLPEGCKSLAFSLSFRAPDRTLKTEEIGKAFDSICSEIGKKFKLRM